MPRSWNLRAAVGAALGASLFAGAATAASEITIGDVAPRDAFVVMSIKDYPGLRAAIDKSGLIEIWNDPRIQGWATKHMKEFNDGLNDMLTELDLTMEDLAPPQGTVGGAIWLAPPAAEGEEPTMHMIALSDFGDQAEKLNTTLTGVLERALDKGHIDLDDEQVGDTTVYTITQIEKPDADEAADAEEDEFGDWEEEEAGPTFEKVHYARKGNYLLTCSDMTALENALDRFDGDDFDSVADNPSLAGTLAQIGDGNQATVAILTAPLFTLMEAQGELAGPMVPLAKELGLFDIKAASMGVNIDAAGAVVENKFGILAEQKKGLVALFDGAAMRFEPPAWVSPDATSISSFHIKFDQILPTIRQALNAMGEDGQQMLQMFGQAETMAGPIFNNLGDNLVIASTIERPFSAESQRMVTAISAKNAEELTKALQTTTAGFGLKAREFQGHTIFSPEQTGMFPVPSIGVGAGFIFIGNDASVEDALRLAAQPAGLGQEEGFKKAMSALSNSGVLFSWTNLADTVEWFQWQAENRRTLLEAQYKEFYGDDPENKEFIDQMVNDEMEALPEWQKEMPDLRILLEHLGDIVTEVQSTPDGFRGRQLILKPAAGE